MKILFNNINHYLAAKQYTGTQKIHFLTIILCVYISYSVFNEN